MKYLFISPIGLALFLVPKLGKEPEVEHIYFAILDSEKKHTGKHLSDCPGWEKLELVTDFHTVLNTESKTNLTIVIDDIGIGETGKYLRDQGWKVIGGTPFTDRIEDDRQFATELMSRVMKVPPSTSFTSFRDAMNLVKGHKPEEILVFKPNDADVPKEYTFVGKQGTQSLLTAMEDFQKEWKWKEDFQIQEFIDGIETDFSAYFNGKEFIDNSLILYFENKAFMNDDIGPATGGSVAVELARPPKGKFWEILKKLEPALKKANYQGQLSVNSIVSKKDKEPYFLEFCGRFGYPSLPLDETLVYDGGKSFHALFQAMVTGKNASELFPTDKIGVTISIFVPPAPMDVNLDVLKGQPISWDTKWEEYFFPYYIQYNPGKKRMELAGTSTWVCQCTCVDKTLKGALSMMYETYMPTFSLKNAEYRTDCGVDAEKRMKALKEMGLL